MKRREFLKFSGVFGFFISGPVLAQKEVPIVAVLVPGDG
jgi:hypothetical protein